MQIKTTNRYHFTPIRMAVIKETREQTLERMLRRESPCALLVRLCHCADSVGIPQWETVLVCDPATPLLGIRAESLSRRAVYTLEVIAALFTVGNTEKHPKGSLADAWIKTHTHRNIIQSQKEILLYNDIDGSCGHCAKWSKSKEKANTTLWPLYAESKTFRLGVSLVAQW